MKFPIRLSIALISCAMPAMLGAAEPATRPARESAPSARAGDGTGPRGMRDGRMFPGGLMRQRLQPPPTTQELEEVRSFIQDHAPNRYALYEQLRENGPARWPVLRMMISRYRNLTQVKERDAGLYELLVKRLELEDEAFGMLRQGGNSSEMQSKLRVKVSQIVQNSITEREKRIEHLEKLLKEERGRLDKDKQDVDALIARQLKQIQNEAAEIARRFEDFGRYRGGQQAREDRNPTTPSLSSPSP